MEEQVYTHALWRVKPGQEEEFVAAWRALSDAFVALPARPLWGTLIRSLADPSVFYSFGPWRSAGDVQAMRADPRAGGDGTRPLALRRGDAGRLRARPARGAVAGPPDCADGRGR
ncbi:MAG TPA: antibiotic biosynthesis monooxygenase [Longimicrobiaceae bacterium]